MLAGLMMILIGMTSCNQDQQAGHVKFGLELNNQGELKSAGTDSVLVAALVTILDEQGNLLLDKEPLELVRFGDQFVTRSLELPVGRYELVEFMLVDGAGTVVWATPLTGSALEHLVNTPLPRSFMVYPGQTTGPDIQVIRVGNYTPGDFGYAEFHIDFVRTFCLKVLFSCMYTNDMDTLRGPDGTWMPWFEPMLQIRAGNRVLVHLPLYPGLNRFQVPIVKQRYLVTATDYLADTIFHQVFSLEELQLFSCRPENPPLMILCGSDSLLLVTPEGLREPTIDQGIFGQLTIPLDDSTDKENYDVTGTIKDVYLFPVEVLDLIYSFAPMGCVYPFDLIRLPPLAIVRSNSDGYFQVPMETGKYIYMVRLDEGYYIDAFISSRRPGLVEVFPGKVTELSIHIIDCSMWM